MRRTEVLLAFVLLAGAALSGRAQVLDPFFTIDLFSPTNGTLLDQSGPVGLFAEVRQPNTLVTFVRVEFFEGSNVVDRVTNSFFFASWDASGLWEPTSGTNFLLTARAIDNLGNVATSQVVRVTVNAPPTVDLTSPTNGQSFLMRESVLIQADAADTDGSVTNVQFFAGTNRVGATSSEPFSFLWTNLIAGVQALTARATDNFGVAATSAPVSITINAAPTVAITSPTNNTLFPSQGSLTITADASDLDGTVTQVEFFADGTLVGMASSAPYALTWMDVIEGSYDLTARVTDDRGETTTSTVVRITVLNAGPIVVILSPPDGSVLLAEADLTFIVDAADPDGTVAAVRLLDGTNSLGNALMISSNMWTLDLNNLLVGTYQVAAEATDNQGSTTLSGLVQVDVLNARIVQPTNNAAFLAGADVTISIELAPSVSAATVELFQGTNLLELFTSPPVSFLWTNVIDGDYALRVRATNSFGSATTSAPVQVGVLSGPRVVEVDPAISSRSGLIEQVVRLTNPTPSVMGSVRVIFLDIPSGLQIFNASGYTNGLPFVQYPLPIQPGEVIDVTVEFYSPTRVPPNAPLSVAVEFADPIAAPTGNGDPQEISRMIRLENGRWLLEFNSLGNRLYYVQYRTNLNAAWTTVVPSILGSGDRVQWVDTGPPRTAPAPETASERFYQVILLP